MTISTTHLTKESIERGHAERERAEAELGMRQRKGLRRVILFLERKCLNDPNVDQEMIDAVYQAMDDNEGMFDEKYLAQPKVKSKPQ